MHEINENLQIYSTVDSEFTEAMKQSGFSRNSEFFEKKNKKEKIFVLKNFVKIDLFLGNTESV